MYWQNGIHLSYSVPGFIMALLVFVAVLKIRKELNHAFVCVFMVSESFNMVSFLNTWLTKNLRSESAFFFYYQWSMTDGLAIKDGQQFLVGYLYFAVIISSALVTMNRFSAIMLPLQHHRIWYHVWKIIFVAHLFGMLTMCLVRFPMNISYVWMNTTQTYLTSSTGDSSRIVTAQMVLGVILLVLCTVCNAIAIFRLSQLHKTDTSRSKTELSYFIISLMIFVGQILSTTYIILNYVFWMAKDSVSLAVVSAFSPFALDSMYLGTSLSCFITPGPIRRKIFSMLKIHQIHNKLCPKDSSIPKQVSANTKPNSPTTLI